MEKLSLGGSGGQRGTGSQRGGGGQVWSELGPCSRGALAPLRLWLGCGGVGQGRLCKGHCTTLGVPLAFGVSPADFNRFPADSG